MITFENKQSAKGLHSKKVRRPAVIPLSAA